MADQNVPAGPGDGDAVTFNRPGYRWAGTRPAGSRPGRPRPTNSRPAGTHRPVR